MSIGNYSKAIIGGLASACSAAAPLLSDGHITPMEGAEIAAAFLAGLGVVYIVPNAAASQGHDKSSETGSQSADAEASSPSAGPTISLDGPTGPDPRDVSQAITDKQAPAAIPAMPDADDSAPAEPVDAGDVPTTSDATTAPAVPIATVAVHQGA